MFKFLVVFVVIISLCMVGCASREGYYSAVNNQNLNIQLENKKQEAQLEYKRDQREDRRLEHNLLMTTLAVKMVDGAAKTSTPVDDILGPILFIVMEDKFATNEMLVAMIESQTEVQIQPMQTIEAPSEGVDYMKAALPYAGYALGAFGVYQYSKSMTDLAAAAGTTYLVSGENNKMNVDAFKSGSSNVVTAGGDSTITGSDTIEGKCDDGECEEEGESTDPDPETELCIGTQPSLPIIRTDSDGTTWVSDQCSCNSYQAQHAGCENPV